MWVPSKHTQLRVVATFILAFVLLLPMIAGEIMATTVSVLDGRVSVTDSANSNNLSGGTVTITAKGSLFSKKTNSITITNETTEKAQLSFDYTTDKANSFKIADANVPASGSYNTTLEAGTSLKITLVSNSGLSNTTATLKLSNFSLTTVKGESSVEFSFTSDLGRVTVDGNAIASGDSVTINGETGAALVATPSSGVIFLGWIDANNKIVSTDASYTLKPAQDMTIKAVFANGTTPWFGVGAASQKSVGIGLLEMDKLNYYQVGVSYLFDDLNKAAAKAAADASNKAVVLMNNGTLNAGTYTIPSGVTLLIPFNSANTMYTTAVQAFENKSYKTPSAYRTLTLAEGANIVINGAMSVSSETSLTNGNAKHGGSPTGPVAFVQMEEMSSITVNNGGALYCWGYITGNGSVTANNGATVYECFQIEDFRGGSQTLDMDDGVFPLSQYYVQNIEVNLTVYSGAKVNAYTTANMTGGNFGIDVPFIGASSSMFNLTSGHFVKRYNGETDRLELELQGNLTLTTFNLDMGTGNINTKNYDLPINGNVSLYITEGSVVNINQDLVMLPGAYVQVDNGATVTLGSGANVYVYDQDQWGNYTGASNKKFYPLTYAPGRTYTRTEADLKDAEMLFDGYGDASAGYIYTTTSGANIWSNGTGVLKMNPGTQTNTHQLVQGTGNTAIPIVPAMLKNGDGTYTETAGTTTATSYTYCSDCMAWLCDDTHGHAVNHATNVELGNSLNMYFAFWNSTPLEDWGDSYYVEIIHTDASGNVVKNTVLEKEQWLTTTVDNQDTWAVYYKGLSAKQMGDEITVKLYRMDKDAEGTIQTVLVDEWSNSVQHYAMRMLGKHSTHETLRTLIVDMLNYGAACQKQFDYDTANLVNAGLSAEQQTWATKTIVWSQTLPSGSNNHLANLIVDGNIQFAISGVNDLSRYSFTNHWGVTRNGQEFKSADNYYYISKLYVADARQVITITVGDTTWTDSVEAYCKRMIDSKNDTNGVCTAFMKFSDAAKAYLEGGNRI